MNLHFIKILNEKVIQLIRHKTGKIKLPMIAASIVVNKHSLPTMFSDFIPFIYSSYNFLNLVKLVLLSYARCLLKKQDT